MRGFGNYLFKDVELDVAMRNRERQISITVQDFTPNYLLNVNVDDLCESLESHYRFDVPVLKVNDTYISEHGETDIDVRHQFDRDIEDRSRPYYIKGTATTFTVPFDGDPHIFKYAPSTFSTGGRPWGAILGTELHLEFKSADHNAGAIKALYDRAIRDIQQNLEWVREQVRPFNENLPQLVRQVITERREKLLKDQGMAAALGFPIRKRDDAPQTYSIPLVKKPYPITLPEVTTAPYEPEPRLNIKEYEGILNIISNMVQVMELSPKAFITMGEEDLRQHFLVQLNGQYEGQATGETFNFEGKTDILIRANGRNVFIAECKFWKSPATLKHTIDQLLRYVSWRDTKTAIILFNRSKKLSAVLNQIPGIVASHPNFKKQESYFGETGFRFVLRQRDDPNREILLTVLVFEVPN